MAELTEAGAIVIPTEGVERVVLSDLMPKLHDLGITSILLEGGATLAWSALYERITDRCLFFYAPKIIGGKDAPQGVGGEGATRLSDAVRLEDIHIKRVGKDLLVNGRVV